MKQANPHKFFAKLLVVASCQLLFAGCDPGVGASGFVYESLDSKKPIPEVIIKVRKGTSEYAQTWTETNETSGSFDTFRIGSHLELEFTKEGLKPVKAKVGGPFGAIETWDVVLVSTNSTNQSQVFRVGKRR